MDRDGWHREIKRFFHTLKRFCIVVKPLLAQGRFGLSATRTRIQTSSN
jgi:hypothetical protein